MLITKEFKWASAHMLPNHDGVCARLHGHNYRAEITVNVPNSALLHSAGSSQEGMVLDFSVLKKITTIGLLDNWDHCFISAGDEWPYYAAKLSRTEQLAFVGVRTTAENLSAVLAETIYHRLQRYGIASPMSIGCTLWETDKNSAFSVMPGCDTWLDTQASMLGARQMNHRVAQKKRWAKWINPNSA